MTHKKTLKTLIAGLSCASFALIPTVLSTSAEASIWSHGQQKAPTTAENLLQISANQKDLDKAKGFVGDMADQAIAFLGDQNLSQDGRKSAFKKLLRDNFDMKTIARFALGRHWRSASKAQQKEYVDLFEKMVLEVYAERFGEYSGQKLTVTGARAEGKSDILVHSNITDQNGGGQAIKVDWRLRSKGNKSKVIDVIVEGVSMSLTQRSDFASVIQRGGGDVEVLLAHLRKQ